MLALNKIELKRPCSDSLRCSDSEKFHLESTLVLESAGRYHGTVLTFSHFVPRSSLPVRVFESIQKLLYLKSPIGCLGNISQYNISSFVQWILLPC